MRARPRLTRVCLGLTVLFTIGLGYEVYKLHQSREFNDAVRSGAYHEAGKHRSWHGAFARAYALQRESDFESALAIYGRVKNSATPGLRTAAEFNSATLHFERALELGATDQIDLALPLIQLAKGGYRGLLRQDSHHWQAKHNLARALQILPEPESQSGYRVRSNLDPARRTQPEISSMVSSARTVPASRLQLAASSSGVRGSSS